MPGAHTPNGQRVGSAAMAAWRLEQLLAVGICCREAGWCVGELRPTELCCLPGGVERRVLAGRRRAHALRRRASAHLRTGHDDGCQTLGISFRVLERMLFEWGDPDQARFLLDAVEEASAAIRAATANQHWSSRRAAEEVFVAVRKRISPAPSTQARCGPERLRAAAPYWVRAARVDLAQRIRNRGRLRRLPPPGESSPA